MCFANYTPLMKFEIPSMNGRNKIMVLIFFSLFFFFYLFFSFSFSFLIPFFHWFCKLYAVNEIRNTFDEWSKQDNGMIDIDFFSLLYFLISCTNLIPYPFLFCFFFIKFSFFYFLPLLFIIHR